MNSMIHDVDKRTAAELAPELARLLGDWLASDMLRGSQEHRALEMFLWDNKMGMLRVMEAVAANKRTG